MAARLLHGSLASGLGADLHPAAGEVAGLFAEHRCAVLVEVTPADLPRLPATLQPRPVATLVPAGGIRHAGGEDLLTPGVIDRWTYTFEETIA